MHEEVQSSSREHEWGCSPKALGNGSEEPSLREAGAAARLFVNVRLLIGFDVPVLIWVPSTWEHDFSSQAN